MIFDGKIVRPVTIDRSRRHHLPLLLTAEGAKAITAPKLMDLRIACDQEIRFVTDSRFVADDLCGCMLIGYHCKGTEFELGAFEWAHMANECLEIDIDIVPLRVLPSLIYNLGKSPVTILH